MSAPTIRKGMPSPKLGEAEFKHRYLERFVDSTFDPVRGEIDRIAGIAFSNYEEGRKAPHTVKAGPGFADPDYDLSVEWLAARREIEAAQRRFEDENAAPRILIVNGAARSEHTCPGEMSKSWRMTMLARDIIAAEPGFEIDVLDLSRLVSEFGRAIHPCKTCVSTAMPLCHFPCSCYPNHSLGQTSDWMNEIYPMWVAAHGVMLITPVNWYQASSPLKLMVDRLVCADGGNVDPTSTHGKRAEEAKALELKGWPFPKHLAGRVFGVVAHGDSAGDENLRRMLTDWLEDMGLISAGPMANINRTIGYYEPYATSHDALDRDRAVQQEAQNVARALVQAVKDRRAGHLEEPGRFLAEPRKK